MIIYSLVTNITFIFGNVLIFNTFSIQVSITGSVMLSIQSRPVFTISIGDMHVDEKDDLTWTCEAFGIPDVKYAWMKNSVAISGNFID